MNPNQTTFTINVNAASGENYAGTFKIWKRLSHRLTLAKDERRRNLIGERAEYVPENIQQNAYILSTCEAHIIEAPSWYRDSANGMDLLDQEPVAEIFNQIVKVLAEVEGELTKKAKAATTELKAAVE